MGRVTFDRKNSVDFSNVIPTIPSLSAGSIKDFRPPRTIESDFKRLLAHDVPYVNFTFDLIHDWYDHMASDASHTYIRAQQTPIDWKSKIGNSDMSTNFKVPHDVEIYKGDMVIREDGKIYLLNWMIQNHPNNQATQSILCNTALTFLRERKEETDDNGYVIKDAGWDVIVDELPCVHTEYAGRPDYVISQGAAGIAPDHLISVSLQWNSHTREIKIDDQFRLGDYTYRVINVSLSEVDIDMEHGVLLINAKRVAGGYSDE